MPWRVDLVDYCAPSPSFLAAVGRGRLSAGMWASSMLIQKWHDGLPAQHRQASDTETASAVSVQAKFGHQPAAHGDKAALIAVSGPWDVDVDQTRGGTLLVGQHENPIGKIDGLL